MKDFEEIKKSSKVWNVLEFVPGTISGYVKLTGCGACTFVCGNNEGGYEHVSVAPTHQFRIPSWEDMAELKDLFFEDEDEAYQIMPKHSHYVNLKENCLHLWRPVNGKTLDDLVGL